MMAMVLRAWLAPWLPLAVLRCVGKPASVSHAESKIV